MKNKLKLINDPVYGFINIPEEIIFDLLNHPYMQRLRRITQLGLTNYVYPGANHKRFEHVLGATHLMNLALDVLRVKGVSISKQEKSGALTAILLHDIGHGPFSHTLERSFFESVSHEDLSLIFMKRLQKEFPSFPGSAIEIFNNSHPKKFLHQLVSGQLDTDRLDYLSRDSFYTGVIEGRIGSARILKMLDVRNSEIAIEEKGIYSVEKFLIARRIMYWQVYLHKTVLAAEQMLMKALQRARELFAERDLPASPAVKFFLTRRVNQHNLNTTDDTGKTPVDHFAQLDDYDIIMALKLWINDKDTVLSELSKRIIHRNLFKVQIQDKSFDPEIIHKKRRELKSELNISETEAEYMVFSNKITNKAYSYHKSAPINILTKTGDINDIADASDISNIKTLSETVEKHFYCFPEL
ncbi:MAG: HD domain-containing protein [Bacteroidota bacterium]|nr:HD domain-containing protein [Bacteroidota bacterium]